jgi:hypothetical protein
VKSRGPRGELAAGQGVVRVAWGKDVVETVDMGRKNKYAFRLWPGLYTLKVGAELPGSNDDFCTRQIRIKAGQDRATFLCTPSEHA